MSVELDKLEAQVTRLKGIAESVKAAFVGLADQIHAVAGDKAKTDALADEVKLRADELTQAVFDNTPTPMPPMPAP